MNQKQEGSFKDEQDQSEHTKPSPVSYLFSSSDSDEGLFVLMLDITIISTTLCELDLYIYHCILL